MPIRRPPALARPTNQLLAALPPEVFTRVARSLHVIPLRLKRVLYKSGDPITAVYFPGDGFVSIGTVLHNGNMIEAATIGREGMVGMAAVLPDAPSPSVALVQGEMDTCYRMPAAAFREEMNRREVFHDVISRFSQAFVEFLMQSTACNAAHSVEQRLVRWLLLAQDRVGQDRFPLTQEFAAMMLGASRPTVSLVAGSLQAAGLIQYRRGWVTIRERAQLELVSCECYRVVTALFRKEFRHAASSGPHRSSVSDQTDSSGPHLEKTSVYLR